MTRVTISKKVYHCDARRIKQGAHIGMTEQWDADFAKCASGDNFGGETGLQGRDGEAEKEY